MVLVYVTSELHRHSVTHRLIYEALLRVMLPRTEQASGFVRDDHRCCSIPTANVTPTTTTHASHVHHLTLLQPQALTH